MRGDQHIVTGILSAALIMLPWMGVITPVAALAIFLGVFIGTLAPDADAPDAAIFHTYTGIGGVSGRLLNTFAVILPLFGYFLRYVVYYPLSAVFLVVFGKRYRHQHRGLMHSLFGVSAATLMIAGCLQVITSLCGGCSEGWLPFFAAAFAGGAVLHLLGDACTPAGIAWLFPLSQRRVRGRILASGWRKSGTDQFPALLGVCIAGVFISGFYQPLPNSWLPVIATGLLITAWLILFLVSGVKW